MKLFEKIMKWFAPIEPLPEKTIEIPSNAFWHPIHPIREGSVRITLDVHQSGDSVDIIMHGLGDVNVCLASFLTKGVSYAQEKYNEYKTKGEEVEPVEELKPNTRKAQKGGRR